MKRYPFRLVNVFAPHRLAGNPLCVFEDGSGLDDTTMQALALQFNLSETTFVLPSTSATARVRIFTPTFEMPFAGHPTLGTAHVVRDLAATGSRVTLEMKAGIIPVEADGDVWTLQARAPTWRRSEASRSDLAGALGLNADDIADEPLWVDTGSEQLIVPIASQDAVRRAAPRPDGLERHARNATRSMAYLFARDPQAPSRVLSRFFFPKHGAVIEDPGTGSACANLGGWLIATGAPLPQQLSISQGEAVGRPCELGLSVDAQRTIRVSGRVIEIARGVVEL